MLWKTLSTLGSVLDGRFDRAVLLAVAYTSSFVSTWRSLTPLLYILDELLEYEEKKRQAEEEKQPLPELVRAKVPFSSCLEAYGAPEQVDDFWSTALQAKSVALK